MAFQQVLAHVQNYICYINYLHAAPQLICLQRQMRVPINMYEPSKQNNYLSFELLQVDFVFGMV